MVEKQDMRVAGLKSIDYKQKLMAFLRMTAQLVDRLEQLAPDVDGNTDPADVRLIQAFRTKLGELSSPKGPKSARRFRGKR
jgi:hypothetical protein